jgi:hypothetical protein
MKELKIKFKGFGGALSATQMKQTIGGVVALPNDEGGCVACGGTCYYDGKKCCPGGSCMERGPEQGRFCN